MKRVRISIKGKQTVNGDSETIELISDGTLRRADGGFKICYRDGELQGYSQKVNTELFVSNHNRAILSRTGGISSKLIIKEGERNNCFYNTAAGELMIGIYGRKVSYDLNESGGTVHLAYTIDQNMQEISKNEVNITVKEL